jgi:hypothetical protein
MGVVGSADCAYARIFNVFATVGAAYESTA